MTTLLFGAVGLSGMRKVQRNYEYYMGNHVRVDKTATKDHVAADAVGVPVASQIADKEPARSVEKTPSSTPSKGLIIGTGVFVQVQSVFGAL